MLSFELKLSDKELRVFYTENRNREVYVGYGTSSESKIKAWLSGLINTLQVDENPTQKPEMENLRSTPVEKEEYMLATS